MGDDQVCGGRGGEIERAGDSGQLSPQERGGKIARTGDDGQPSPRGGSDEIAIACAGDRV